MSTVAIFDMNETTLDLDPVRAVVDELIAPVGGFTVWFQKLLQLSMTVTATLHYVDFATLARTALHAVADTGRVELSDDAWEQVASSMGKLEPYPDVEIGLTALREAGWTLVALTNSAPDSVRGQLNRTGLAPLFSHILSVEAVGRFKPAPEPYRHAAEVIGIDPAEAWMVACHDWDLAGARSVGLSTAFVERPGMSYASVYSPANLMVADFIDLADQLIAAPDPG